MSAVLSSLAKPTLTRIPRNATSCQFARYLGIPEDSDLYEVLEEDEFEPMFAALEGELRGKKVGLFGSYGWGDGQWMRDWEERCVNAGIDLASDSVTANDEPDDDALAACRELGAALA